MIKRHRNRQSNPQPIRPLTKAGGFSVALGGDAELKAELRARPLGRQRMLRLRSGLQRRFSMIPSRNAAAGQTEPHSLGAVHRIWLSRRRAPAPAADVLGSRA